MKTEEIKSVPIQWREVQIDQSRVEDEARTIDLSFSSETPVERFFGNEILDHDPSSVRLGRFANGAAVLVDHDRKDHVGVVDSVSLSERVGRATVRLGQSARASEIWQDVKDGIRHAVSIGYRIHKVVLEESSDEGETYRATDWEPLELSFVSIPADPSVGVGRNADVTNQCIFVEDKAMPEKSVAEETRSAPEPVVKVDVKAEREKARADELKRIRTLTAIGDKFNMQDAAQQFIDAGKSESDFRDHVLANVEQRQEELATQLDLTPKEVRQYSLLRGLRAMTSGRMEKDAPFELECSEAIEERMGRSPQGMFVPWDVQADTGFSRAAPMDTTENTHLVGTDHLAGSFIELLRAETVVIQSGARMLAGLVGNVDIPKQAGKATFFWVAEDGEPTDAEVTTATVSLSPTTLAGAVPITRRLLKQSSPDAEAIVRADLIQGAAEAIDLAALEGSGASNQPLGIVGQSGVLTSTIVVAGSPTWSELVEFETDLAGANALRGMPAFVTTPAVVGNLKTTVKDAGSGRFLLENGEANGYPVRTTTQISANRIIFGNYSDVLIGMWGVLDLMADTSTKAASGGLVIRVFQDLDVAVRHGQSFCINA